MTLTDSVRSRLKTRTIEITFESVEVLVIKQRGKLAKAWCPNCGKRVGMISTEEAGEAGLTPQVICERAGDSQLHLIEPGGGLSFICLNSVMERVRQTASVRTK
jgi:hypothetical protein